MGYFGALVQYASIFSTVLYPILEEHVKFTAMSDLQGHTILVTELYIAENADERCKYDTAN